MNSNYILVVASVKMQETKWQIEERRKVIRIGALRKQGRSDEYVESINEKLESTGDNLEELQEVV